ncbi:homoserine O-acetyltransferase [Microbacteriaceae bacterium 4G12]
MIVGTIRKEKRGNHFMIVEKKSFSVQAYSLECGRRIPITLGYETYGTLNHDKSNVILICHYFSATSHAAGKYEETDATPGWWDSLIGPEKAIDTNRFFVICTDNLCNVQVKNPRVITTGPATINPETGKPYGMNFPPFTFRDMAGIQRELLQSLGINRLYAVAGPSAGGMTALHWAVCYPDMVESCIGVITNAQNPIITSCSVLQHAIRAIELDPNWKNGTYYGGQEPVEGLHLASQMMFMGAYTPDWYEENFPRSNTSNPTSFEESIYNAIRTNIQYCDANHWIYTCRATMLHDIAHGFPSLEAALSRIQARVLLISCQQDLLQPSHFSRQTIEQLQQLGKEAAFYEFESINGHMGGVFDPHLFEGQIRKWLQ